MDQISKANAALAVGGVAAAVALLSRVKGVSPESVPPGTNLNSFQVNDLLAAILSALTEIDTGVRLLGTQGIQGYPSNQSGFVVARVRIPALDTAYRFPDIPVPNGMMAVFKAWPLNGGLVYLGGSDNEARNLESVYPLLANEIGRLQIENFNQAWVAGITAGASVVGDSVVGMIEFPRRRV